VRRPAEALLLAELIIRCVLWVALSCSKDEMLRSLLPPVHWLFVDGLASTSHVVASTLALMEVGDELAVDMASCLRTLRLISLVRSFSAAELVLDVLRQSAHALKGPMYCCSVYSVLLGITIYYVETLSAPEDEEVMIDTLANAFWYCWVTFSTVGYGDITPTSGWASSSARWALSAECCGLPCRSRSSARPSKSTGTEGT